MGLIRIIIEKIDNAINGWNICRKISSFNMLKNMERTHANELGIALPE